MNPDRDFSSADKMLGMDRPIGRREFLDGMAVTAGAISSGILPGIALPAPGSDAAPAQYPLYYPPALTDRMRGSHAGSFEAAHALRDGRPLSAIRNRDAETYDLVIVGGGISGLAAAYFYREQRPDARILILDNHDDFGGHAKRNEFDSSGGHPPLLMNGGTLDIDSPRPYSREANGLLEKLGIDPIMFDKTFARKDFYQRLGLRPGIFFDRKAFERDHLVVVDDDPNWDRLLTGAPLSAAARRDIAKIQNDTIDYLDYLNTPDRKTTSERKKQRLARISYRRYLLEEIKADPGVIPYYQEMTHHEFGVGIDAVSALDVWGVGDPMLGGFQGLGLDKGAAPRMGITASGYADGGSYRFHFPDGNASIARLLVRSLIPQAMPGRDIADVVTARADYAKLDRRDSQVRIRLNNVAVRVRNDGPDVEVTYANSRDGDLDRLGAVRGRHCVLACWNMIIPYLCPELPDRQKNALHALVKTPLVYSTVMLRNWRAFEKLGIYRAYCPGCFHSKIWLNETVDIGAYTFARSSDQPMLIRMLRVPCAPGLNQRAQNQAGRAELMDPAMNFAGFEREIREQLAHLLGPGGFDPASDIEHITVNRWPHGYAYEYNPLDDPEWSNNDYDRPDLPHVIGRQPFGRIAIANSDSGALAYTDSAIDQARRAVGEVLAMAP